MIKKCKIGERAYQNKNQMMTNYGKINTTDFERTNNKKVST